MSSSGERFRRIKLMRRPDSIVRGIYDLSAQGRHDEAFELGEHHVAMADGPRRSDLRQALAFSYSVAAEALGPSTDDATEEQRNTLYARAAAHLAAELEEHPGQLHILDQLGAVYGDMWDDANALACYRAIDQLLPNNGYTLASMANYHALAGEGTEAEAAARRVLQAVRRESRTVENRMLESFAAGGLVQGLFLQDRQEDARAELTAARKRDPDNVMLLGLSIMMHMQAENYDMAYKLGTRAMNQALTVEGRAHWIPLMLPYLRLAANMTGNNNNYASYVALSKDGEHIDQANDSYDPIGRELTTDDIRELLRELNPIGNVARSKMFRADQMPRPIDRQAGMGISYHPPG